MTLVVEQPATSAELGRSQVAGLVLIGVAGLAYAAWAVLGGPSNDHQIARASITVAAAITTAACISAARRNGGMARQGWLLIAVAAGCWTASNGVAAATEIAGGRTLPVPSPGDAPSALAGILLILAILTFLHPALPGAERLRSLLDALLVTAAALFIGWALVLDDLYRMNQAEDAVGRAWALAYPASDLVVAALVVVTLTRLHTRARRTWLVLAVGLVLQSFGHTALAYLQIAHAYEPGRLDTASWFAGCLLIGVAALLPGSDLAPDERERHTGRIPEVFVPLIPVALAAPIAAARLRGDEMDAFLIITGAGMIGLLVTRQAVAQLGQMSLARELEHRIAQRTAQLEQQERGFRAIVQHASDMVTVIDASNVIRYQSTASERVIGQPFGSLVGRRVDVLFPQASAEKMIRTLWAAPRPPAEPAVHEVLLQSATGEQVLCEVTVANLLGDDAVRGLLMTCRDITVRRGLEDDLRYHALHDALTGLGNRVLFSDRLMHAVTRAKRTGDTIAVLILDLDGFKQVNDSLGHAAGDQLLVEVASRLRDSTRDGDTIARMGGDEFAVLLERPSDDVHTVVGQRILNRLRAPMEILGRPLVIHGSIGAARGQATDSAEDLLRNADLAMYEAKSRGKGTIVEFEPAMQSIARHRLELEADLRRALTVDELVLHYQAIVDLRTGTVSGAEALCRWIHPERGMISPLEFIPLAEESDLVHNLGRYVLRMACNQAKAYIDGLEPGRPFFMAVNLSARQVMAPWIVGQVQEVLAETGMPAHQLVLEITESALISDEVGIAETLRALKALGVQLAIDDFGTGWSSLSRLRNFPVDKLKIDRSFISEIKTAEDEAPIVAAIVTMAHSLGLTTVAEGVESFEQLACLRHHGCEEVQGYALARPVEPELFGQLLVRDADEVVGIVSGPLSASESRLADVVAEVIAGDEDVVAPALAQLHAMTGADAVYMTRLDWNALTEEVVATGPGRAVPEGTVMAWTPIVGLEDGSGRIVLDELSAQHPDHPLVERFGIGGSFIAVPLEAPGRHVVGMLCAASRTPAAIDDGTVGLFDLFARMLVDHVEPEPARTV